MVWWNLLLFGCVRRRLLRASLGITSSIDRSKANSSVLRSATCFYNKNLPHEIVNIAHRVKLKLQSSGICGRLRSNVWLVVGASVYLWFVKSEVQDKQERMRVCTVVRSLRLVHS